MPRDDLMQHVVDRDGDCVCGPLVVPVEADGFGWMYMHHSLDGRELIERSPGGS